MKIVASTDRAFIPTLKKVAVARAHSRSGGREAGEGDSTSRRTGRRQSGPPLHEAI